MIEERVLLILAMHCFLSVHAYQVSSGLERGGFTLQGDIHGKDFGKFKLERQGKCSYVVVICFFLSKYQFGLQMIALKSNGKVLTLERT